MKIMVCGYGRHGKDTVSELLGVPFASSSWVGMLETVWPDWGRHHYTTPEECFEDRHNHRATWFSMIAQYNTPDKLKLAKALFSLCDVYCGCRNRAEFEAIKEARLVDLTIWVDGKRREPIECTDSCEIDALMCDIVIDNNGSLEELKQKVAGLRKMFTLAQNPVNLVAENKTTLTTVQRRVIDWADEVFPDRTIRNALTKMVMEEIPEYLMSSNDPGELADIGILFFDVVHLAGYDLNEIMNTKMDVNEKRKWIIDKESGLMRHQRNVFAD